MNIIIAGDGQVGSSLTQQLSREGYDVTLIDNNPAVLSASVERYDVLGVQGNCASMDVLRDAGVWDADLLIAATSADEINLLCCTTAHAMNPNLHTIARIRNPEYIEQIYEMRDTFGLSMVINPERQAAMEIVAAAGQNIGLELTTLYPEWSIYQTVYTNPNQTEYDIFMQSPPAAVTSVSTPMPALTSCWQRSPSPPTRLS